jgi:hypothetical protein
VAPLALEVARLKSALGGHGSRPLILREGAGITFPPKASQATWLTRRPMGQSALLSAPLNEACRPRRPNPIFGLCASAVGPVRLEPSRGGADRSGPVALKPLFARRDFRQYVSQDAPTQTENRVRVSLTLTMSVRLRGA